MEHPVLHPAGAIAHFSREIRRLAEDRVARQRRVAARHQRLIMASERVEQLEEDLARAAITLRSLTDAVLKAGILTRAELSDAIRRVDLLDGRIDGKHDPAGLRPPDDPLLTAEESLRRLAAGG